MSDNVIPLDYVNNLVYELEKAFWDERGKGARFRMTTVGSGYFKEKCLPLLQSTDTDDILHTIDGLLCRDGIVESISFNREERLLRVRVKGCLHRQVEDQMIAQGIEPFTCIPANLIVLAIEEKLDLPVELAEIKVVDGACELLLVIFEQRPTLV
jgi:hypothetical protein